MVSRNILLAQRERIMPYIYVIENKSNGKFYAGSTNNFNRRWPEHKKKLRKNKHPTPHLQASWNKYGEESFSFKVVCECSNEQRTFYEELFIKSATYNVKLKVNSVAKISRQKISEAKKGVPLTEEHKEALSKAKKGVPVSDKKHEQLKQHWKKFFSDEEQVIKRSARIKEKYKDPILREKMRQQAGKRWSKKNAICS